LCKKKWKASSGTGAGLHGARWNPAGVEVVYASSSPALCILERIVHFTAGDLPDDDVLTEIQIPDTVQIEYVPDDQLPANWDALIDHPEPRALKHLAVDGQQNSAVVFCRFHRPSCQQSETLSSILPTPIFEKLSSYPQNLLGSTHG
jgi:RES domain-containing protein